MRYSCALMAQLYAEPLSDTTVPKRGLAITLTQGAGVVLFLSIIILYSLPSCVKPPVPLKNKRLPGMATDCCCACNVFGFASNKEGNGFSEICLLTCSSKLPLSEIIN